MAPIRLTVTILWGALMASVVVCAVVAHLTPAESGRTGVAALPLIGASLVAASVVVRKILLKSFLSGEAKLDSQKQQSRYLTGHIVVYAMAESCGVLGLVHALAGGSPETARGMFAAALIALAWMKPVKVEAG